MPKGWTRPVLTSDNAKTKPWRQQIAGAAIHAMNGELPTGEPIEIHLEFVMAKPKSTSRKVVYKTTKPDVDKLQRAAFDSLTGIVFADDSQVVKVIATKRFGTPERVEIRVFSLDDSTDEKLSPPAAKTFMQEKLFA